MSHARERGKVRARLSVVGVIAAVLLGAGCGAESQEVPQKPNIVFVLTDDQDAASVKFMPMVKRRLTIQGANVENFVFTNPLCCPSRVSILRGQYSPLEAEATTAELSARLEALKACSGDSCRAAEDAP